jgi:hypothetical protein|tara:strand:- start:8224 stop:8880 length:657 start_codon:yes stop_codon:yes gene_type:complete
MTFEESYQKYLLLSESNGITNNLSTNKGKYAAMFNIAQNKVIEWLIESNGADENRYLQQIKETALLIVGTPTDRYIPYTIPADYFDFINLFVKGKESTCILEFVTQEIKNENASQAYNDILTEPSFKYAETFFTVSKDSINLYKKGFDFDSVHLHYYKEPTQVTLIDPDDPESNFSVLDHQFDDKLINRVILSAVSLHQLSSDDAKYQAFKQETVQKF